MGARGCGRAPCCQGRFPAPPPPRPLLIEHRNNESPAKHRPFRVSSRYPNVLARQNHVTITFVSKLPCSRRGDPSSLPGGLSTPRDVPSRPLADEALSPRAPSSAFSKGDARGLGRALPLHKHTLPLASSERRRPVAGTSRDACGADQGHGPECSASQRAAWLPAAAAAPTARRPPKPQHGRATGRCPAPRHSEGAF